MKKNKTKLPGREKEKRKVTEIEKQNRPKKNFTKEESYGTKSKNKKMQLINSRKTAIVGIVILAIIVYCVYIVVKLVKNPTDTFSVEQGRIYQEQTTVGYIIRQETVVKGSNYKNGMEQIKTEGERVAKGDPIFRYYTSGEESLVKKITDLDSKIDEVMTKENSLPTGDMKVLEKQIDEKLEALYSMNNLQNISEEKKQISNNITKKAQIAGEYSPAGSYLKKLIDERKKYENQLHEGAEYLTAPESGVVSYKVDGYEEILTTKDFSVLTKNLLEELNVKTGQIVTDSKESGKIIDNFKCYIACILNSKQAKEAKVGDEVTLRLPNGNEIESSIEYISKEEENILLVFKIEKSVQDLISYRKISFDIIWWSHSGKKIPNEAIGTETKEENEVHYVIRTRAGYKDKIWVKIKRQNEKYAIVDNYNSEELKELGYSDEEIKGRNALTLYDEVLKNPTQ